MAISFSFAERTSFKGISFDTDAKSFKEQLVAAGYTITSEDKLPSSRVYSFEGNFAGNINCEVLVFTSLDESCIGKVVVYLPKQEYNWSYLKRDFNKMKDAYEQKYGAPIKDYHFFSSPYEEGDGYEMTAVKVEKCHYATFWETEETGIYIEISKYCQVKITYEDKKNFGIIKNAKNQVIQEDI